MNDNIQENEAQEIRWSDEYKVANITEYHIISKLNSLRIIIPKFMIIRQLFYIKNVCENVQNQHVYMDVWTFWSH